jgi:hypothetical protein
VIRNIDDVATSYTNGRWKDKIQRVRPTDYLLPDASPKNVDRLAEGIHQRCNSSDLSRATIAGSHVNENRLDGIQSFSAKTSEQTGQRRYRRPAGAHGRLDVAFSGRKVSDFVNKVPIVGKIDVMDVVKETQFEQRRRQFLEGTSSTYSDVYATECFLQRGRILQIRDDGLESLGVEGPPACNNQIALDKAEKVFHQQAAEIPCTSDDQNPLAGHVASSIAVTNIASKCRCYATG